MKSAEPLKYAPRMVPQTASKRSYWGGTTHGVVRQHPIGRGYPVRISAWRFDNATQEPVYFVSSEVNAMANVIDGGSHYPVPSVARVTGTWAGPTTGAIPRNSSRRPSTLLRSTLE